MTMVTDLEKKIYNAWLKAIATQQGRPFSYKKNWDSFEKDSKYPLVKRIANLMFKFKEINIEDFFNAPYGLFGNEGSTYPLDFYVSQRSLGIYKQYLKKKELDGDIDNNKTIQIEIKNSLKFLGNFFIRNNIKSVRDYLSYQGLSGPMFVEHLKNRNVSIYVYIGMKGFYAALQQLENDIRSLFLGGYVDNYIKYKSNLDNSKSTKQLIEKGLSSIEKIQKNY